MYDPLVDTGASIERVQVKTCTTRIAGSWMCSIRRSEYARGPGGKRQVHYCAEEIDYFAVVDGDLHVHLIPITVVAGLGTLAVRKYAAFRVPHQVPGDV